MLINPYALPTIARGRRHGPGGYAHYRAYKDWLRDEFAFRCGYCMFREKWDKNGNWDFHVEHRISKKADPSRECDYDNLIYACEKCNIYKGNAIMPDPCEEPLGLHYRFAQDGTVEPLTEIGATYIEILALDDPQVVDYRARWLASIREFIENCDDTEESTRIDGLERWFGFPIDIPDLRSKQESTNSRKEGREQCYFARLERGEIPRIY